MALNGATLLPIVSDALKEIIGASVNNNAGTIRNLEGDLKSLAQELTGYILKKKEGDEKAQELYELSQSRMDIIETRIKLLDADADNTRTRALISTLINVVLKVAVL
jgi:hypothetical protein